MLVSLSSMLAALPLLALGEDTPAPIAPTATTAELLDVREHVEQANADALEQAPDAIGKRCHETAPIDGIGDACLDKNSGLLRVEQADGRSHTIHGMDAPPIGAAGYAPSSQAAVNGASPASVTCVPNSSPHYTLVYAYPNDVASRYSTIAPLLQNEVYKVSAFIDSESRSIEPSAGRSIPVRCDGTTEPTVLNAKLSSLKSNQATFATIVDALRGQGYEFNGDKTGMERYIIYYDSPSPTLAAGTGHVFTSDDSNRASNQNNNGGLYSIEYRFAQGGGVPHWDVLVHEIMHTMGAVVDSAPNATGRGLGTGGHCNDGEDIMCYNDGGPRSSYRPNVCPAKVLDCNRDDYFNPAPAAGSHLNSHWNAAASYNRYLLGTNANQPPDPISEIPTGDTHDPRAIPEAITVKRVKQSGSSRSAVGISWAASAEASEYVVKLKLPNGRWKVAVITSRNSASISKLRPKKRYVVSVAARSESAGIGPATTVNVKTNNRTDRSRPSRPGPVQGTIKGTDLIFTWRAPRDNVGVESFAVTRIDRARNGKPRVYRYKKTPNSSLAIPIKGLGNRPSFTFEITAKDAAGNVSLPRTFVVKITQSKRHRNAR